MSHDDNPPMLTRERREALETHMSAALTTREREMLEHWLPIAQLANPQLGETGARMLLERALLLIASGEVRALTAGYAILREIIALQGNRQATHRMTTPLREVRGPSGRVYSLAKLTPSEREQLDGIASRIAE